MKKKSADVFKRKVSQEDDRMVFMFHSEKSAKQFGHRIASVPKGKKGSKKQIQYTTLAIDENADEYKWPDKKLVWKGKISDQTFISEIKPNAIKPLSLRPF